MTSTRDNSDQSNGFKTLGALIWLSLPATVVLYALAWDQLPARLATHFDFSGHPNGWMSREGSLVFFILFATLISATVAWVLSRVRRPDSPAWALVSLFCIIGGLLLGADGAVISY